MEREAKFYAAALYAIGQYVVGCKWTAEERAAAANAVIAEQRKRGLLDDLRTALLDEAVKALKALELQALQSGVNRPSNEWGMEALEMTRSVLARIDALEKSNEGR